MRHPCPPEHLPAMGCLLEIASRPTKSQLGMLLLHHRHSTPGRTRTRDLSLNRRLLLPTELPRYYFFQQCSDQVHGCNPLSFINTIPYSILSYGLYMSSPKLVEPAVWKYVLICIKPISFPTLAL